LHPILEINARKTMSWAALEIQKRLYPGQAIEVSFAQLGTNLLPQAVSTTTGKTISFKRRLSIQKYLPNFTCP
jgi:hypothetical protein